ncbi:tyrosine-protein phosphatase [Streptomyces sp. NPDC091371]|uniref:tyrosine-protein phosphatase n=1 Tax=Streptomyces sp. NPDC091371 TaxID=3155303 RepID=UPI00341B98FA
MKHMHDPQTATAGAATMTATLPSTTVANLRDLGGTPLTGGRTVRPGLVLRSGQLDRLDLDADPTVAALGLTTVIDFRSEAERTSYPDRVPAGARNLVGDVLADKMNSGKMPAAAQLKDLLSDPVVAEERLGGGKAQALFGEVYRSLVSSGSAQASYRMLLTELADPQAGPLLFHCTAGKDRTGWGATIILSLLGADDDTLMAEYLSVNPAVKQAFAPMIEGFTAAGGDPDIALALIGVFPSYLEAALDEVETRYGSMEKYVREGLGVSDETVEALRARLIA